MKIKLIFASIAFWLYTLLSASQCLANGHDIALSEYERRQHMMQPIIAYCGLVCSNCPTFLATQNDDDAAREKAAALYSKKYGLNFTPKEINCDGCTSEGGKLIGYCQSCEIRKCAREKSLDNCAVCGQQPCEKLTKFHEFSADAKRRFDALGTENNNRQSFQVP